VLFFFVQNRKKGTDATVMLAAVNEIQGLDAHLAASERFGVICVLFGEACMKLDRVKEATEICVRAAKWPALTERVVALFEKAGNMALEAGQLDDAIVRLTLCMDLSFPPSESVLYSRACAYQRKVSQGCFFVFSRAQKKVSRECTEKLAQTLPSCWSCVQRVAIIRQAKRKLASPSDQARWFQSFIVCLAWPSTPRPKKSSVRFESLPSQHIRTRLFLFLFVFLRFLTVVCQVADDEDEAELEESTKRFRAISEAYLTLSDTDKRREYDIKHNVLDRDPDEVPFE
jgi:hypothetical protein